MPYSRKAKYHHKRQKSPKLYRRGSFKTVPFHHAEYSGKKYKRWHRKGSGAKAVVGKLKKSGKWSTQSILIPKKTPGGKK